MDLHDTLSVFTIAGLATSFIAGVVSQMWRSSVEIEGTISKRLTPAGWLLVGIALVGLLSAVASELVRVSLRHNDAREASAEAMRRQAQQEQEARWKADTRVLSTAKTEIEVNIGHTVAGFLDTQSRFNQTQ